MFGADMFGTILRGMGLDPELVMQTATQLNGGVERIAVALERQGQQLAAIRELQNAMATHMGLYQAPLDPDAVAAAARETQRVLAPFGGSLPPPPVLEGAAS